MPAPSASQAEPVTAAVLAAAKAASSFFPSRLMSRTPERSENSPDMAQNTSGVATRSGASKENTRLSRKSATARLAFLRGGTLQAGSQPQVAALDRTLHHEGQRAGEQDDQALNGHHHLAGHLGFLEGALGADLVQHSEPQTRHHNPPRDRNSPM